MLEERVERVGARSAQPLAGALEGFSEHPLALRTVCELRPAPNDAVWVPAWRSEYFCR